MERFPGKFGINPKRDGASTVNEPSGGALQRKKAGKTYEDLPAEAKKACDKFARNAVQLGRWTREPTNWMISGAE